MEQARWCSSQKSTGELSQGHQFSGRGLNLVAPKWEPGLMVIQTQISSSSAWCVAVSGPSVCWSEQDSKQLALRHVNTNLATHVHVAYSPTKRIYPETRRRASKTKKLNGPCCADYTELVWKEQQMALGWRKAFGCCENVNWVVCSERSRWYCEGSDTARDVSNIAKEVSDTARGISDTVRDVSDTAREVSDVAKEVILQGELATRWGMQAILRGK